MTMEKFVREGAPALAYAKTPGEGPVVVFLHGLKSDMEGTKAVYLEERCRERGQAFLRLDCRGHGKSDGMFEEGTISLWKDDALAVIDAVTDGPVVLVGSSMGGWLALLAAIERPEKICGVVGIAAAPDFSREMEKDMNGEQRRELAETGFFTLPSDYDEPYRISKALLEDGERNCLLDKTHSVSMPVRLIQGKRDDAVHWETAEKILTQFTGDVAVHYVGDGDHRLSRAEDLAQIDRLVQEVISGCTQTSACRGASGP